MLNTETCKKYYHHGEGYRRVLVRNGHVYFSGSRNVNADDPCCAILRYGGRVEHVVNLYNKGVISND